MNHATEASERRKFDLARSPLANAAVGAFGAGLGVGAVSATLPVVIPAMAVGAVIAYLLTRQIPSE